MNIVTGRPVRHFVVAVSASLLLAAHASAAPTPETAKSSGALRSGSTSLAAGADLQPGVAYSPSGLQEAKVSTASGASFRAMPGSRFLLVAAETGRLAVRLDEGVIADADGAGGRIEIVTPSAVLVGERAVV